MKTSKPTWQESLHAICDQIWNNQTPSTAVVGVGQELRGDDAAGVLVARKLNAKLERNSTWTVFEAGIAPENILGSLRKKAPRLIIYVDAVDMGEPPGTVRIFEMNELGGYSGSTHTIPAEMFANYITAEIDSAMIVLGIQVESFEFDQGVSKAVSEAIHEVTQILAELAKQ